MFHWIIICLLVILIGFTGNIVSLLRDQKKSNRRIIEILDKKNK
ncbi:hypothetical protein P8807_09830 [Bacillus subtilis]|nr:hypothetical protein [Bacillus subtilis]MDQ4711629.1 hypothetical protein [Bacillus subtilis]MEC0326979.1 hypothetical protein [Bacillus subtilis]MEC0390523.1 hypothetical protein [Bacillus subtilis]MEC0397452.1 hypothetical protein [Bacillus subtilis]MEC0412116.1 hypothetical protein [Bacillus subtilis]